jgi:hypothetical protein
VAICPFAKSALNDVPREGSNGFAGIKVMTRDDSDYVNVRD